MSWIRVVNRIKSIGSYRKKETRISHFPTAIWVELTNACNLGCIMCPNGLGMTGTKRGFMSWKLFTKIVDEIAPFESNVMLFLGGESLLHKDFLKMLSYVKSKNIAISLNTNGTVLTESISQGLLAAGVDFLTFSFDGYTKEEYEKVRVHAKYEKVLENMKSFLRQKKAMIKNSTFVTIYTLFMTPDKKNSEEENRFKAQFEGLPVDRFLTDIPSNWGGKLEEKDDLQLTKFGKGMNPCHRVWQNFGILWDGQVVPCCADLTGAMAMGNANDHPLFEILNSTPYLNLRKAMVTCDVKKYELCRNCNEIHPKNLFRGVPTQMFYGFKTDIAATLLGKTLMRKLKGFWSRN